MARKIVKQWLVYAVKDMKLAQHILELGSKQKYAAAFHAQQSVEKACKAVLVFHGQRPPKVHDIESLGKLLEPFEPTLARAAKRLKGLSRFAVIYRYPDAELKPVNFSTIKTAVRKSKEFYDMAAEIVRS